MNEFTNELITRLSTRLPIGELRIVKTEIEALADDYEITKRTTDLVLYTGERPEFYETFFACKALAGSAPSTLKLYKYHLDRFFAFANRPVEQITNGTVRSFLAKLLGSGKTKSYVDSFRRSINIFFKWATDEGYVARNPVVGVDAIKYRSAPRSPLNDAEIEQLRDACAGCSRDLALIEFLLATGARVSEAACININDINFQTHEVHLFGKGSKHRTSYINDRALYRLREYLETRTDRNEALFVSIREPHSRITKNGIQSIINKAAADGGLTRSIHPHLFRHTFATNLIRHGADLTTIQRLLGHESPETTLVYAHLVQDSIRSDYVRHAS